MPQRQVRFACIVAVALVAHWWCVTDARGQASPTASNSNDSARVILQRYADAWRGRQELALDGPLLIAFSVRGTQGGEFNLTLTQDAGAIVREGMPAQYDIAFQLDMDFLRRLDRGEMSALRRWGKPGAPTRSPSVQRQVLSFSRDQTLPFSSVGCHSTSRTASGLK